MKIVELICNPSGNTMIPQIFTVGSVPLNSIGAELADMGVVVSIRYNRYAYNKGYQGDYPSYTIEFENSDVRGIIPEGQMQRLGVDIESGKKDDVETAAPGLPD